MSSHRGEPEGSPLARTNDSAPGEAALLYAAEMGWLVFPVDGKVPLTKRGLYDATTDEEQIRRWWLKWPEANVAMPTGEASGVVVIDGDGADGIANAKKLLSEDALVALQVVTGGGGRHNFFQHPGAGRSVPNSAGRLAPAVDVRGDGGYVVLPPSRTEGSYRWANPDGDRMRWRWDTSDAQENGAVVLGELRAVEVEDPTAAVKRSQLLETLRDAPEGTRNHTLFQVASDLGFLVGAGALDAERSATALAEVGVAVGLDDHEVPATVRSGILNGAAKAPRPIAPGTLDIGQILDGAVAFQKRFVVFAHDCQADALALWAVHTHCAQAATCTPYIWVSSPAPTSGKTRLAEVHELLVRNPIRASDASPSSIFRSIPLFQPTLLLDEIDTKFKVKGDDNAEDLRRLINSGFNRGAYVLRVEGRDRVPTKFDTYCPKMLIGIDTGAFPDTVAKRSIPIRLHRKTRSEQVERFRRRKVDAEAERIRAALATWAEAHASALAAAEPGLPDELNDRQHDAWEPLLAIADLAGPGWAKRARDAARYLHGTLEEETTDGVLLLEHIRDAFDELKTDRLLTGVLLTALIQREEGPWAIWWERAISSENIKGPGSKLARMLKVFGIHSKTIRTDGGRGKGYERAEFEKTWERYFDLHTPPSGRDKGASAGSATCDVTTVTSETPLYEDEGGDT